MVQLVCVHGGINSSHKIESLSRPHGSFLVKPLRISENCHNPSYQVNQETIIHPNPFLSNRRIHPNTFRSNHHIIFLSQRVVRGYVGLTSF